MKKNDYYKRLTYYFRNSILDGERLSPNTKALLDAIKPEQFSQIKKDAPFAVPITVWEQGQMDTTTTETIFTTMKVEPEVDEVGIVLMPRIDLIKTVSGQAIGKQSEIITPLVTQARLQRTGQLQPDTTTPPFVPREWLAPNQSDQTPFAHVAAMDNFITQNPYNITDWASLKDYCQRLLAALVEDTTQNTNAATSLHDFPIMDDYQVRPDICLILLEPPIKAGFHILKIYDAIIRNAKLNQLFTRVFDYSVVERSSYQDLTHDLDAGLDHVGQMTDEFPLADKQRNALHYISRMQTGDILPVNGPPGTGKTTLLRSVVANAWVQAALVAKEPPIIVAASSSNQAVTNILDSFQRIEETQIEAALKGRWLPGIDAYGLYACGENKANAANPYPYMTKKGAGLMSAMETEQPLETMVAHYLEKVNAWQQGNTLFTVADATQQLHQALHACVQSQQQLQQHCHTYQQAKHTCTQHYGSEAQLLTFIQQQQTEQQQINEALQKADSLLDTFLESWQQRSLIESALGFLPWIKKRWQLNNERLARKLNLSVADTTDKAIRAAINQQTDTIKQALSQIQHKLEQARTLQNQLQQTQQQLIEQLASAKLDVDTTNLTYPSLINALDTSLRFRAFKLATHYWEGRWLQDMETPLAASKTPAQRLINYKRYAKLAPCFVSTFNMLPNFFEVSSSDGEGWISTPLTDCADLLIVDEAGQALPHIAGASFLIAQKALLVGDIYQIEPVWSIPRGVDRANLQFNQLLNDTLDYKGFWLDSDLLASSGNLMKAAHRKTPYQQFDDLEQGLYLTEHRRCYDSIIQYCNRLIYQGHLEPKRGEPKRGEPKTSQLLPTMGFLQHESTSQRVGASRTNPVEAAFICNWIQSNRVALTHKDSLENVIAIITPFAMQAKTIRHELNKAGLGGIKVGTVHTFQGAECNTILFSSVYAANDVSGSKFYDRGSNMMNVAVSRAKNSFIVVGDKSVFGKGDINSPSGMLMPLLSPVAHELAHSTPISA